MEDGRWKMEDGRWKMENGKWKMEKAIKSRTGVSPVRTPSRTRLACQVNDGRGNKD